MYCFQCVYLQMFKNPSESREISIILQCKAQVWVKWPSFLAFYDQPGMHVNGAPQMMQPPNMGVVPGPMAVPGPGQGPVPVGPPGNHQTAWILPSTAEPIVVTSFVFKTGVWGSLMNVEMWKCAVRLFFVSPVSFAKGNPNLLNNSFQPWSQPKHPIVVKKFDGWLKEILYLIHTYIVLHFLMLS